jgi:hypothetical protein
MVALEKMFDSRTIQRDFEQSMDYYENKAPKELLDKFTGELLNEFSQLEYGPINPGLLNLNWFLYSKVKETTHNLATHIEKCDQKLSEVYEYFSVIP